jgi:ectoine hydroxylase-related dioxygenase (phytanoyl-CoA dioxygenase family)
MIESAIKGVLEEGFYVLKGHIPKEVLHEWRREFAPLLYKHIERDGRTLNRGSERYYVTLPFHLPFADPAIFENDLLLSIVEGLVGKDPVMCQLATDTPLLGSDFQDTHRDTFPLFPEWGRETPPFQLAINFPLVDVGPENGPMEIARGTHMVSRTEGLEGLRRGDFKLEPIYMELGDIIIRDVRGLHRGTPNRSAVPRPMVVIGYSRSWMLRPEVCIHVPQSVLESLSDRARRLLRFNPVVKTLAEAPQNERYDSFAY